MSCWVIVEPPCITRPARTLVQAARMSPRGIEAAVLEEPVVLGGEDGVQKDQRHVGQSHRPMLFARPIVGAGQDLGLERGGADVVAAPGHARDPLVPDVEPHELARRRRRRRAGRSPRPRPRGGTGRAPSGSSRVSAYFSRASVPARSTRRTWTPATSGCGAAYMSVARRASTRPKRASATEEYVTSAATSTARRASVANPSRRRRRPGSHSAEPRRRKPLHGLIMPAASTPRRCEGVSHTRHRISFAPVRRPT